MRISLSGIIVNDQDKALKFYTDVLGFKKKNEIPMGEFKWLTVVSSEQPEGTELSLEPNANPAASTFQKAMYDQGIPITAFEVDDIDSVHQRLSENGVTFKKEPTDAGPVMMAMFDDTCGNLIQIYQVK